MNIVIVTDAWHPQINGVVHTLDRTRQELEQHGHRVRMITPQGFRTIPCPTYPEIQLCLFPGRALRGELEDFAPDAVHIATEGPLGMAARRWCLKNRFPFTTSFHTRFPEYVNLRIGLPVGAGYAWLRRFHGAAVRTMVTTESMRAELEAKGFSNLVIWSRGVDTEVFQPYSDATLAGARPIFMFVGRVAVEKNIEAFLTLDLRGTKYVIGDGPDLEKLKQAHPEVRFPGYKTGIDLARYFAAADVLVFPSRTDTFGLVLLEANACGTPVAAYPVPGPKDVVVEGETGCLDEDLARAARNALALERRRCREYALQFTWAENTKRFEQLLCFNGKAEDQARSVAAL